jgi:hypothetical protein
MKRKPMNRKTLLTVIAFALTVLRLDAQKTENLILITIDGCRWQEVFMGADTAVMNAAGQVKDRARFARQYWDKDPMVRRQKLMPFLWTNIATEGMILGNRSLGNKVNVANQMWFSYPGYSEILCGFADDANIHSNDLIPNPNNHVLELISASPGFHEKVAVYSSWDAFPYIVNENRNKIPVNAGFELVTGEDLSENELLLNKMMREVPEFIQDVRNDAFTFYMGFEYLKRIKPRVLYLALDETDDLAHMGRYDLYMQAITYTDHMISELWNWLQSEQQYRDKTTILITVDHGRGMGPEGWKHHGKATPGSDETWFAVMGPDTPVQGEISTPAQYYNSQFATTMAAFLGLDYSGKHETGATIPVVFNE